MRLLIAALFASASFAAFGANLENSYDALVEKAKAEGELHFMASGETFGGQETMKQLQDAFNKKYSANINLRFTPGPSMPAMAARLQQEAKSGAPASTDLYIGNLASIAFLNRDGVLEKIEWADVFPEVAPEMEITKGAGVLVRTSLSGIVFNSDNLKGDAAPKSYADLVDPAKADAWKGRLATPPYHDWIVVQSLEKPKEEVIAYAQALAPLVSGFIRYGEEERVVSGEFAAMASTGDAPGYTALWQKRGAPLNFVLGTSPTPTDYFQVAVPANSAHPNLAALFAAFLVTPEAQEIIDRNSFQGSHLSPNTSVAKFIAESGAQPMDPQKLNEFFQSPEYAELTAEIRKIFQR